MSAERPAASSDVLALGTRVAYLVTKREVALGVVEAIYEDGRMRVRWDDGWTDDEGVVYGFDDLLRVKS